MMKMIIRMMIKMSFIIIMNIRSAALVHHTDMILSYLLECDY
jgi:hypothetical protein